MLDVHRSFKAVLAESVSNKLQPLLKPLKEQYVLTRRALPLNYVLLYERKGQGATSEQSKIEPRNYSLHREE